MDHITYCYFYLLFLLFCLSICFLKYNTRHIYLSCRVCYQLLDVHTVVRGKPFSLWLLVRWMLLVPLIFLISYWLLSVRNNEVQFAGEITRLSLHFGNHIRRAEGWVYSNFGSPSPNDYYKWYNKTYMALDEF